MLSKQDQHHVVDPTPIDCCTGQEHPTPIDPTLRAPTPIVLTGQAVCITAGAIPTVYITGVAIPTVYMTVAGL